MLSSDIRRSSVFLFWRIDYFFLGLKPTVFIIFLIIKLISYIIHIFEEINHKPDIYELRFEFCQQNITIIYKNRKEKKSLEMNV